MQIIGGMTVTDDFLAEAERELEFILDLIARIEAGSLDPAGLDREAAILFLAEIALGRRRMIDRLQPYAADDAAAWTGAPV